MWLVCFLLHVVIADFTETCGKRYRLSTNSSVIINTPYFPKNYNTGLTCIWYFTSDITEVPTREYRQASEIFSQMNISPPGINPQQVYLYIWKNLFVPFYGTKDKNINTLAVQLPFTILFPFEQQATVRWMMWYIEACFIFRLIA